MTPSPSAWETSRHLLNRAGFGGTFAEISAFADLPPAARVDALLSDTPNWQCPAPDWLPEADALAVRRRNLSREERQEAIASNRGWNRDLLQAWVTSMVATKSPAAAFRARMTLLWHNHFATSARKVRAAGMIWRQLAMLQEHCLSNLRSLLHGIVRDPAMLIYLDNVRSRRGSPNENLARELMELFALGNGAYTETDIREAARALTGHSIDGDDFRFRPFMHDSGPKEILGQRGNWRGEDLVDILLQQPAFATFIVSKIWRELAGEQASMEPVPALAEHFREADYELQPLLRAMLQRPEFYAPEVVGQQIKGPLQLIAGACRVMGVEGLQGMAVQRLLALMGQVPYMPPNVKGWPGGRAWIDTSRLMTRLAFGELIAGGGGGGAMMAMMRQRSSLTVTPQRLCDVTAEPVEQLRQVCAVLLAVPPSADELATLAEPFLATFPNDPQTACRQLVGSIMLLPQFQLC